MNSHAKVIAAHLIYGVDPDWEDYLYELLENAKEKDIPIDFENAASPLPKQLRNSCVMKEFKDGTREYVSSQVWLAIDEKGRRSIIEPKETSGVLIEGETGCILKPFNHLPEVTPKDTQHLIRILIRKELNPFTKQHSVNMSWKLYTNMCS